MGLISRGKDEAELVAGGARHGATGYYVEPTVFLNPRDDAEIYRNEIFGPVSIVKTFETEDEVVRLANDTEFGLVAGVFTRDVSRALRLAHQLEAGVIGVNCVSLVCIAIMRSVQCNLHRIN
jgi:aldehyde dehydrogenase (NAD+)/retinal dehydrogenase